MDPNETIVIGLFCSNEIIVFRCVSILVVGIAIGSFGPENPGGFPPVILPILVLGMAIGSFVCDIKRQYNFVPTVQSRVGLVQIPSFANGANMVFLESNS